MKPGLHTTEFWLLLTTAVIGAGLTRFEQVDGTAAFVTTGILTGIYTILRSALKSKSGN